MILGVGTDMVDVTRIATALEEHKQQFKNRVFTRSEQDYAEARPDPAAAYAKRFAAKEAFAKALGVGLKGLGAGHDKGVSFTEIEVSNTELGKPELTVSGSALDVLSEQVRAASGGEGVKIHLSLSDELPFATAYVIIETV
ncbi:MAG: holo-ACP synthase [Parvibaculales bacterium]